MNMRKKGLGRGLDALLTPRRRSDESEAEVEGQLTSLPIDRLQRGQYQPRTYFDEAALQDLADSIKAQGLVQPIVVRPINNQKHYEIIAGERRWRAAQMAGLHEVSVVVREVPDQAVVCIALIENIQREDLNPIEEAQALYRLIREFEMTHEKVASAVGRSRSSVTNLLRLLDLESEVRGLVEDGTIEMGHARALLGLKGLDQRKAAQFVKEKRLTVRETEAYVKNYHRPGRINATSKRDKDPNINRLEQELSDYLSTEVTIKCRANKGSLEIRYHSFDELQGILEKIKK